LRRGGGVAPYNYPSPPAGEGPGVRACGGLTVIKNMQLSLGYSPCPNDTFIFYALTHDRVSIPGVTLAESLEDVETLNRRALHAELDLTKVSFHAFAYLMDNYCLLKAGAALGRGCGPLVVTKRSIGMDALRGKKFAIPGMYTTAHLLLMLYGEGYDDITVMPFDAVMDAVSTGEADAGLVIHEGRFTYSARGLFKALDLGEWWEAQTGLPIPLGGILARRSLGSEVVSKVEEAIRQSILYARSHAEETKAYIKAHARELDDRVIEEHIALYVNDFSLDLSIEGVRAVEELLNRAADRGVVPRATAPIFL
jgi:1,4-dihydroxy-6-naphthoate synthase